MLKTLVDIGHEWSIWGTRRCYWRSITSCSYRTRAHNVGFFHPDLGCLESIWVFRFNYEKANLCKRWYAWISMWSLSRDL